MYLRFQSSLEFPALAHALCEQLTEDNINWGSENVYEWMWVDLPQLDFSLNISREHGLADVEDEVLDRYRDDEEELKRIVRSGPIYVMGWNRNRDEYVDQLPDFLAKYIADRLSVDVFGFHRRINVDVADGEPDFVVVPGPRFSE